MTKAQPPISPSSNAAMASASFPEPPSDLELMQFFDGELDEPRKSAVALFVGADLSARNKLAGMRITSAIVQNEAASIRAADDIADLVFAKLASEKAIASAVAAAPEAKVIPLQTPATRAASSIQSQPATAIPRARPANDNGRRIFAFAALAVAAAAALTVWGRRDGGPAMPSQPEPVAVMTAPGVPTSINAASSGEPEIDAAATVTPDGDMEHGVEVAAVNFGAHMGSIFYVPSDAAGARPLPKGSAEAQRTTTVVWLTDDAGE